MPTAAHFIYIPAMLMLGFVLGHIFGSRAAKDAQLADEARKEARAARRARNAAAAVGANPAAGGEDGASDPPAELPPA